MTSKAIATLVVIVSAVLAAQWLCVAPMVTNSRIPALITRTRQSVSGAPASAAPLSRANIAAIQTLLTRTPTNVDLLMLLAANYATLGNRVEAAKAYERALQIEGRPEIHLNLGLVLLEGGSRDRAVQHLASAVRFQPSLIEEINGRDLRAEIERRARQIRP